MKRISLYIQCLALILLMCSASLRSWGTGEIGTQLLQSTGSCSSFNLTGESESGTSSDEAASLTGAPIDIPAPVAKNDDGIDPQSVYFESAGGRVGQTRIAMASKQAASGSSQTVGTLYAKTINNIERVVGVVLNGQFIDFFIATNGEVALPVQKAWVGKSIALVVLSENSNSENVERVSRPVVVTFNKDDHFNTIVASVSITNVSARTNTNPTTIRNSEITFIDNNRIAFSTTDPSIGTIDVNYGFNETLTSDILEPLDGLTLIGDNLFGFYSTLMNTVEVSSDGTMQSEPGSDFPAQRIICGSPDGQYLASNAKDGASEDLVILDLTTHANYVAIVSPAEPDLEITACTWRNNSQIVVTKKALGNYALELYDITDLISGASTTVTPTTLIAPQTDRIGQVAIDPTTRNSATNIAFECNDDDVCLTTAGSVDPPEAIHEDGHASNIRYLPDGSGVVYQLNYGSTHADNALVYLNPNTGETTFLTLGLKPAVSLDNSNIISYLSVVGNTLQIGLLNLDFAL